MGKLFGTDGVRGIANQELTCDLAFSLGRAAAVVLTRQTKHKAKFVIGKDTRISSDMLECAMAAGICSAGCDVVSLGVIPTPAVAYLVKKYDADAGVVISASHNPFEHNGIKIFSGGGYKLSDALENEIEDVVLNGREVPEPVGAGLGRLTTARTAVDDYVKALYDTTDTLFENIRVCIDCANGAASVTAPKLFDRLGCKCVVINNQPDGTNINAGCGSTHIEALAKETVRNRCQLGIAFDGDADRLQAVDENGVLVDGDRLMAIFANYMKAHGTLKKDTVVATTMSNLGLFKMAEKNEMTVLKTAVGDRYVLEEMLRGDYNLGGESSGHIILRDYATTGDGELAAVFLINILYETKKKLSQLAAVMERYPQVMINIKVPNDRKQGAMESAPVRAKIAEGERQLTGEGRILVRASGTEPLIRVMVEGRDLDTIGTVAKAIADALEAYLKA